MADITIHGKCDPKFDAAKEALRENISSGQDVGACFAATLDGELIIDIWGGHADEAKTRPWEQDTIINVYSTTKTMTALSAHLLADRGELDFDAPVAEYWPEFAANGKENICVKHFMSHSAGLSGWEQPIEISDLYDWNKATSLLAAQAPWWEAGTQSGYHALTQGYLTGEVVRRISGKSLGQFFKTEIAEPLGADFHIGLDASHDARVAELIPPQSGPGGQANDPDSIAGKTFGNPEMSALASRTREWRATEIPAANGHGNARSVAQVQSILACGGEVGGKRFMSEASTRRVLEEQTNGQDVVLGVPIRHGLGYGLQNPLFPLGPSENVAFWGGWGGSLIVVDFDKRLTFSFVMNNMNATLTGDLRPMGMIQALYAGLS